MARKQYTGEFKVAVLPAVADPSAPTIAEITAGDDITAFFARDGLRTPSAGRTTDISDASDRQDKRTLGTFGGEDFTWNLWRDDVPANDTAWTVLADGTTGLWAVIRRFGGADVAFAALDVVECHPIDVVSRSPADSSADGGQMFTALLAVRDAIVWDAVVAA